MSVVDSLAISLDEVNKVLAEIENKYSPVKNSKRKDGFEETLGVLSKELDSVGLSTLDLSQSLNKIFKQVVAAARSLVHIHRKAISKIKDVNIDNQCKTTKSGELHKVVEDYKSQVDRCEDKNTELQSKITKLSSENAELARREIFLKNELDKVKRYHNSKQNELLINVRKLTKENQNLKEMLNKHIDSPSSKDDVTLKLLNKYQSKEDIYRTTIRKLKENNEELLEEIVNLRENHAIRICAEGDHP